jgi:CheY-like chemotaxis protein
LIVEDQRENWLLLQRILSDAGFQVQVAKDGAEGVEMFQTWRPHFICMDIRLPLLGGLDAVREIRALKGGLQVKIVAVTAFTLTTKPGELVAAGLDDFIRKPYRPEEIFDCLDRHLGVRYRYGDDLEASLSPVARLEREALARLPEALRIELRKAVVRLDPGQIREVIHQVAEMDAGLAEALALRAKRFTCTEIFDALEGSLSQSAGGSL